MALTASAVIAQSADALDHVTNKSEFDSDASVQWAKRAMRPAKPLLDDLGITIDVNAIKDGLQNGAVVAAKFVATHALTIGQSLKPTCA